MTQNEILRRTSRSFYLTIRLLPRAVRGEVAVAYLLARATDTIADSSSENPVRRIELLRAARAALGQPEIPDYDAAAWAQRQRDPAERELLRHWPLLWRALHEAPAETAPLLHRVLSLIIDGQIFDLQRFGAGAPPLDDAELERYTYLVAGSVGEFWTDLCAVRGREFFSAPEDVMRQRARHYGQALQLVNILRDRAMDAALGRVYVTASDAPRWTAQAREWLGEGADYCAALRSGRLRYATLLPALLGWRTLAAVEAHPAGMLTPSKVSRSELRQWMWRALPVWWSKASVADLARRAARSG
jgi:farnesyl-diphosphate farnesyltransferase